MNKTKNLNQLIFLMISLLVFFIPFREMLAYYTFPFVKSIPDILVLSVFVYYLFHIKFQIRLDKIDLAFAIYLLIELISTLFINHVGLKAYIVQVRSICLYYVLFYILKNYQFPQEGYKRVIPMIKIVLYVIFALSVIEKLFAKTVLFPVEWKESIIYMDNFIRTYGVFNNPNTYAAFVIFAFIYVYQLVDEFWCKKNIIFIIVCISAMLLTVSRSTIILFIFFIIVLLITQQMMKRKGHAISLIPVKPFMLCLVSSIVIWGGAEVFSSYYMDHVVYADEEGTGASALDRFNELVGDKIVNASQSSGRLYSITKGLEIVKDHPILGTGFGTYGSSASLICGSPIYEKYDIEGSFYSDNEYIKILVEGGILGALAFVAFLSTILYTYRKQPFKLLVCVIMGGLGLFYNIFEVQILAFMFWITLTVPERRELQGGILNEHS